jgi:hypothetical protein
MKRVALVKQKRAVRAHTIGTTVDQAEDERELAFVVNSQAPGVMAAWAAGRGVPLIHFSTDYVFGGKGETPWREDSRTGPLPRGTHLRRRPASLRGAALWCVLRRDPPASVTPCDIAGLELAPILL